LTPTSLFDRDLLLLRDLLASTSIFIRYMAVNYITHCIQISRTHMPAVDFCVLSLGVPRRQPHRRSGLATLPSLGAVP